MGSYDHPGQQITEDHPLVQSLKYDGRDRRNTKDQRKAGQELTCGRHRV